MVYQLYPALTLELVPVVVVPAAAVIGSRLYSPPAEAPEGVLLVQPSPPDSPRPHPAGC